MSARVAKLSRRSDGKVVLACPEVGLWREAPAVGAWVAPGAPIGRIEQLGRLYPVHAPDEAYGLVVAQGGDPSRARRPMAHGETLLVLDPELGKSQALARPDSAARAAQGLVFRAPSSGRYYGRPAPDKPPFVAVGDIITSGHTVGIIEVMKTFQRLHYEGAGLPESARVARIVPADGDDLAPGDPILELEPTG